MSCGLSFGTHPNNGWHMWFNSEAPGGVTHNDVGGYPRFTADTTMKPWEFHVASELKPSPIFRQTRCKCLLKTSVVGLHQSMWKKSTRASHQAIISHSWYQTGDSHDLNRRYIWMECTGRPTAGWKIGKKNCELHFEFFESLNFGDKSVYLQVILVILGQKPRSSKNFFGSQPHDATWTQWVTKKTHPFHAESGGIRRWWDGVPQSSRYRYWRNRIPPGHAQGMSAWQWRQWQQCPVGPQQRFRTGSIYVQCITILLGSYFSIFVGESHRPTTMGVTPSGTETLLKKHRLFGATHQH